MKLGVSNLAWDRSLENEAFRMLRQFNAQGVEVAPTRIAPWDELTSANLGEYRRNCEAHGLEVSSMQAILFNQPDAQLLADEAAFEKLVRHMETIGEISKTLAAKVSVFGAPGNRKRGALSLLEARTIGLPRMRILGDVAAKYDYLIGIESVPEYYKCDFLDRVDDVAQFVSECGHEKVVTHFDIACITLGGDNPVDKLDRLLKIAHFHASEPDLAGFAEPKCDHPSVAAKLKTIGYENWVVIEMRQIGTDLEALETALDYVSRTYGFN